jgi:hypothetical protein
VVVLKTSSSGAQSRGVEPRRRGARRPRAGIQLDMDVKVILTPPSIFD